MLKTNSYFNGKVVSIGLQTSTLAATVGVMDVGDYQFDTSQHEVITVISGKLSVKLPGSELWQDFVDGDSFEVAPNQVFELRVALQTAYFCTYQDKQTLR